MADFKQGDYVRVGGPSILAGLQGVVIQDMGDEVYLVTPSFDPGSRQRLLRSGLPKSDVELWKNEFFEEEERDGRVPRR